MITTSLKSKKGNVPLALIIICVVLIVFVTVSFFGYTYLNEFKNDLLADSETPTVVKTEVTKQTTNMVNTLDYLTITILLLCWVILIIASFLIDTHPIFFILSVFIMIFALGFAALTGNIYGMLLDDVDFANFSISFPITNWVMTHILQIMVVIGFSALAALYAKLR